MINWQIKSRLSRYRDTTEIWNVAHDFHHLVTTCDGEDELPRIKTYIETIKRLLTCMKILKKRFWHA